MRAMILAAGRGTRMGSLTDVVPKPLLKVKDKYLIEYSLELLSKNDIKEVVVNISYHREQIKKILGNGSRYGLSIIYSEEEQALETGGGIVKALPLLGDDAFIVLSADVITDFNLKKFSNIELHSDKLAHLVVIKNPSYHPKGDFKLEQGLLKPLAEITTHNESYTFANIGYYHPKLFAGYQSNYFRLGEIFKKVIPENKITGECFSGLWFNVGTSEDLHSANQFT